MVGPSASGPAVYHAELARHLQALGYQVDANPRGLVRIAGISEDVIGTFSKRRRQILAEVKRRDGSSHADHQRALARTGFSVPAQGGHRVQTGGAAARNPNR
jgi:conjugative relaxase-like TrwC/TraI family protein